jgi:hypothetical protein
VPRVLGLEGLVMSTIGGGSCDLCCEVRPVESAPGPEIPVLETFLVGFFGGFGFRVTEEMGIF